MARIAAIVLGGAALLAVIGFGAWWFATADERERDRVDDVIADARRAAGAFDEPADEAALCRLLTKDSRARVEALARAQHLDGADRCEDALEDGDWRLDPLAATASEQPRIRSTVEVDGDRATARIFQGRQRLRLRREGGRWRVDLMADRQWNWKMDLATGCGITSRRLLAAGVPGTSVSSFQRMYRAEDRALGRFAKVGRAGRPIEPASKVARRSIVKRARRGAARSERMVRIVRRMASIERTSRPVRDPRRSERNRLPASLGMEVQREIGGCLVDRGKSYDTGIDNNATRRVVSERCRDWFGALDRGVKARPSTLEEWRGNQDRLVRKLDRLARPVDRVAVPRELRSLRRRVRARVAEARGLLRDLVVYARRGDLTAVNRTTLPFGRAEFGMRIGLSQLGVGCGDGL